MLRAAAQTFKTKRIVWRTRSGRLLYAMQWRTVAAKIGGENNSSAIFFFPLPTLDQGLTHLPLVDFIYR
jgi:hypothetical protein